MSGNEQSTDSSEQNTEKNTNIRLKFSATYLLGGRFNKNGDIIGKSLKPIPHTLIGLEEAEVLPLSHLPLSA